MEGTEYTAVYLHYSLEYLDCEYISLLCIGTYPQSGWGHRGRHHGDETLPVHHLQCTTESSPHSDASDMKPARHLVLHRGRFGVRTGPPLTSLIHAA